MEVTIQHQHTPSSLDSPGSPRQHKNLGLELVDKGEPQKFAKPFCPKPCKCGHKRSHNQSFSHNFPNKEKKKKQAAEHFLFKKGLNKPPTPLEKIGGGDHNLYKEKKGAC